MMPVVDGEITSFDRDIVTILLMRYQVLRHRGHPNGWHARTFSDPPILQRPAAAPLTWTAITLAARHPSILHFKTIFIANL
jgi:hypothetical protein